MKLWNLLLPAILLTISCTSRNKKAVPAINEHILQDTTAMIQQLERAFANQPLATTGLELANLYAETKNARAIELCDAMLKSDKANELVDAVFIKGIYYANINEDDKALEQLEACIKMDWKFTEAYIEKGLIFYERNDINNALQTFELAAKVSNTYADAYYWIGKCYEKLKRKQDAIDNYSRALSLDKDFTEARQGIDRLDGL